MAVIRAWLSWQTALSFAVQTAAFTLALPRYSETTLAVVAAAIQLAG